MFIVELILYAVIGVVAIVATRTFCRYVVGPTYRKGRDKKKFYKAYTRFGGMPYVTQMLCADPHVMLQGISYKGCLSDKKWWCGPDKFWEGPPAPKAKHIEAWEDQKFLNKVARERAHMEVYGVSYPHDC